MLCCPVEWSVGCKKACFVSKASVCCIVDHALKVRECVVSKCDAVKSSLCMSVRPVLIISNYVPLVSVTMYH